MGMLMKKSLLIIRGVEVRPEEVECSEVATEPGLHGKYRVLFLVSDL